jgi:cyclohexadienyl dehydratase
VTDFKSVSSKKALNHSARKIYATLFVIGSAVSVLGGCLHPTTRSHPESVLAEKTLPSQPASLIRVGTSGDYPPFSHWPTGQEEPTGFSVDVARAWAGAEGHTLGWHRFTWPELASDLSLQRFDLALSGVTVRPDRSISGRFSLPLTTSGAVALVDQRGPLHTLRDLNQSDRSIAVNAGGHLERVAITLFPRAQIHPISRNAEVPGQLGQADIDVVVTDTLEAPIWQAAHPNLRKIGPLTNDRKAAWFPPSQNELAQEFDRWLLLAEEKGTLARIRADHGLSPDATAGPTAALLASLDERLSLMVEVARSKQIRKAPVQDANREERVLTAALAGIRLAAERQQAEVPPDAVVRRLYRAQIEAAKWIQQNWLDAQSLESVPGSDADGAKALERLEEEIRPALLFLGNRIAGLVIAASSPLEDPGVARAPLSYASVQRALGRHSLPEKTLRELYDALVEIGVRPLRGLHEETRSGPHQHRKN